MVDLDLRLLVQFLLAPAYLHFWLHHQRIQPALNSVLLLELIFSLVILLQSAEADGALFSFHFLIHLH
jgi:hypothetical protein